MVYFKFFDLYMEVIIGSLFWFNYLIIMSVGRDLYWYSNLLLY